jgi:hypothetical protein
MDCFKQTCEKRIEDWSNASAPPKPDPNSPVNRLSAMGKWEMRMAQWNERRQDAAAGNVLGPIEMPVVKAAVRQYGYTYGKQKPHEVAAVMGEIVKMYPGTPMAKVAQEHIERAGKITEKELFGNLPEGIEKMPALSAREVNPEQKGETTNSSPTGKPKQLENVGKVEASGDGQRWGYWLAGAAAAVIVLGIKIVHIYRRRRITQQR